MAFQIDPRIPLQALANPINIGDSFAKAQTYQANALKLQQLRDAYDAEKADRLRQKQMRSGIQADIEQIQRGIPAQYSPLQYQQTPQTGQMPNGMTGVLANERGQNMPQPQAFGEDILSGNFNLNREMVAPAQEGRQPTPEEYVQILAKQAMMYGDEKSGFEALKLAAELEKKKGLGTEYFGGLTAAVDESGNPTFLANTKSGVVPVKGYAPPPKEQTPKAVPIMVNGVPKTVKVPATNEVKILMSDGSLMSGGSIPVIRESNENKPQQYFANDGLTGYAFLNTLPPQDKARVQAIIRGDMPFPSTTAIRRDPNMARFAEAVFKADPSYSDMKYTNKKTAAKAFQPGQKLGQLILSNASARGHMDVLQEVYDAMTNKDIKRLNEFANYFKVQTGGAPEATFDAIKGVIGSEIMKSIVPGGGGVVEREEIRDTLSRGYSPAQFMSVLNGYRALMQEQYDNMHQDYKRMELPEHQWPTYKTHAEKMKEHGKKEGGKDPYASTNGKDPRRDKYLLNHKALVDAKDYEGAKLLTELYNKGAK